MTISSEIKVLGAVLGVTLLIIVGGALLVSRGGESEKALPVAAPERLVRETSPVFGALDAQVTVVEFGDFECPACGALHFILKDVKAATADKSVRYVYRHFPLQQHRNAQPAAEAAVEAQAQGKFWEFHDVLFANQTALDHVNLEKYAAEVGLNIEAFTKALDDNTHREQVLRDRDDGNALRVSSTPTIFINGVQFTGQFTAQGLEAAIDAALQASNPPASAAGPLK